MASVWTEPLTWRGKLVVLGVMLVLLVGGWFGLPPLLGYLDERQLQAVIADLERTDPGWRLEEWGERRPALAHADNGATHVLEVWHYLPAREKHLRGNVPLDKMFDEQFRAVDLGDVFRSQRVCCRLGEQFRAPIERYLSARPRTLEEARKLYATPRGHYALSGDAAQLLNRPACLEPLGATVRVLALDVAHQADRLDISQALRSCRALIHAARTLEQEPGLDAQQAWMTHLQEAAKAIQYTLGQGEANAEELAALQRLVEDLERHPFFEVGFAGERARLDRLFEAVARGKVAPERIVQHHSGFYKSSDPSRQRSWDDDLLSEKRQRLFEVTGAYVQLARLPPEELWRRLPEAEPVTNARGDLIAYLLGQRSLNFSGASYLVYADLRCLTVLLAVERYRVKHKRWPEQLDDLVPEFLDRVPVHPFDGTPIVYRQFAKGVQVYAEGAGVETNDTTVQQGDDGSVGYGICGFRLWVPAHRHAPPPPPPAPPPPQPD